MATGQFTVIESSLMSLDGPERTYRDVRYPSTFEGKADISQRLPNNHDS